ncbi:unnamed protein product, partial [marine sediment metagenome]
SLGTSAIIRCYVYADNSGDALAVAGHSSGAAMRYCVIVAPSGHSGRLISGAGSLVVTNSILIGAGSGNALNQSDTTSPSAGGIENSTIVNFAYLIQESVFGSGSFGFSSPFEIRNNILYDMTGGITASAGGDVQSIHFDRNAWGAITGNKYDSEDKYEIDGDIDLTVSPFTDYDNGDYTLNGTSGGGAECKDIGVDLLDGNHTTYTTLGAINEARRVMLGLQLKT